MTKHNCFWLGEHYGKHIGTKIAEMTQKAIEDGRGRQELADDLRNALGGEVGGYKYWDVVSSAALVRARSFGAISGMEEAGIAEYEILAMQDERMCPICGEMHGRVFSVVESRKVIDRVLEIEDSDKFKEAMPWQTESPKGVNNFDLQNAGMSLPPFHGRCRCTVVMVSSYELSNDLRLSSEKGIIYQSGALNDRNDPYGLRRGAHAERYYAEMRNSKSEFIVDKLSKYGKIPLPMAQKVFNHVFINKYDLDEGFKRFDPSYDMSESFQRLLEGKDIQKHDLTLLYHERLEYELMNRYGKDARTAHSITNLKHNYEKELDEWLGDKQ